MVKIGCDISLRSSGISVVENDKLVECFIFQPIETCYEQLITDSFLFYYDFFIKMNKKYQIECVNIEDLSLGSLSSVKDVIATNYWNIRSILHNLKIDYKIFSPSNWRKINEIVPKDKKQKEYKEELGKNYLKILAMNKLDEKTKDKILKFCCDNNLKKDSHFDLIESYFIGCC